eukprot:11156565-Ditylum_brightwellii.AAC.1
MHASGLDSAWHLRCHLGKGKKRVHTSEHCVQQPVCNTTHTGRVGSNMWSLGLSQSRRGVKVQLSINSNLSPSIVYMESSAADMAAKDIS